MKKLVIFDVLNTPNAILHSFGMQVYREATNLLKESKCIVIDFSGLSNITSAFAHASIGNLHRDLNEGFKSRVEIIGLEEHPEWREKIDNAIYLAQNPEKREEIEQSLAALFGE